MSAFQIHEQLVKDCHRLGRFEHCHLLLHRNALLHWFILVPETEVVDLLDLESGIRDGVMAESAAISTYLKTHLNYPKVNFASLGNVVPQLHLHVVGRKPGDAVWPAPVWGNLTSSTVYAEQQVRAIMDALVTETAFARC